MHAGEDMKTEEPREKMSILSYGLLAMTLSHIMTHVFQRIHLTLFPVIRSEFSLSLLQLGVIAGIPHLCQALFYLPSGLLSDRFGSKRMILLSLLVAALGSFMASQTINPTMLIVSVSLVYINTTVYHPAAYSFTTRLFKLRDRAKALGIHGCGGTFGMAIGPISVGILMGILAFGWRQVYLFWFVPILLGIIVVLRIRFEPKDDLKDDDRRPKPSFQTNSLFTSSLVMFLVFLSVRMWAWQMISAFLPIYLVDEKGLNNVISSLVYGSSSLMGLVAAPVGGLMASRFGEKKWLLTVLSLSYIFLGLAVAIPNVTVFIILYLSYSFCSFLGMAANSAIMAQLSPSHRRGLAYALFFLPGSIMGAVAPPMAAYIAGAFGLTSIFAFALVGFVVGLVALKLGVEIRRIP